MEANPERWRAIMELLAGLREIHAIEEPRKRRGLSWGRTLFFAQASLGARGHALRRGTPDHPFVIWVLGACQEAEGSLAEQDFFGDANWQDRAATEVVLLGESWNPSEVNVEPQESRPAVVRTLLYGEAKSWIEVRGIPDLVAYLMPADTGEALVNWPPEEVLQVVAEIPTVVSTRFPLAKSIASRLEMLGERLVLPQIRCPFSSYAGEESTSFDDNGWIFAVRGSHALAFVLDIGLRPPAPVPGDKLSAVFWGILDIKYDSSLPILDRVRVLETGDGRTSKFTGDGAPVKELFDQCYRLVEDSSVQRKFHVISADKKLTHDFMAKSGYEHVIPQQVCYVRQYDMHLSDRICTELSVGPDDFVILKLLNRSRAAGVLVVPVDELDEVLEELLSFGGALEEPFKNIYKSDQWFKKGLDRLSSGSVTDIGVKAGSFQEQSLHWWSNECPCFVVERLCKSMPIFHNGCAYDSTLRVAFALRRKDRQSEKEFDKMFAHRKNDQPEKSAEEDDDDEGERHRHLTTEVLAPEDLTVDWLGGYWKLPKGDMESGILRDRVVSAARTSGTAPARRTHLYEVYAALSDSVVQLFSSMEPTDTFLMEQYAGMPELAGYFQAKFGLWAESPAKMKRKLYDAQVSIEKCSASLGKNAVLSLIQRGQGIIEGKSDKKDKWRTAKNCFQASVRCLPSNGTAWYLKGQCELELGNPKEAVQSMNHCLLLDPDFRAPYINLGVAYLQQQMYECVIQISDACLARHPQSPQCYYHIFVACCQLALLLEAKASAGISVLESEVMEHEEMRKRALDCYQEARNSPAALKRKGSPQNPSPNPVPPWLEVDANMRNAMLKPWGARARKKVTTIIELPKKAGWHLLGWRT